MRRGAIWWARLRRQPRPRPVVLLSRDEAYEIRAMITVSPVTTRVRGISAEVPLGPEDGLPEVSVVNLDTIMTIAKDNLVERIGDLSLEKLDEVEDAIHYALGLRT